MTELKIGDIVTLKSGSPKMTIHKTPVWVPTKGIYDKNLAVCSWFDNENKPHRKEFRIEELILV